MHYESPDRSQPLAERLVDATYWLKGEFDRVYAGYFGVSTGAAAALVAAAELGEIVGTLHPVYNVRA